MAVNYTKLNTLLNAILSKDVDDIVAKQVYLPFIGNIYTVAGLQTWLKKRTDLLEDVKNGNYTDQQISNFVTNAYNSLKQADKQIADKILAGEPYELNTDADGYEKLVLIILYKFVTT